MREIAVLMRERNVGSVVLVDGGARSASSPTATWRCRSSPTGATRRPRGRSRLLAGDHRRAGHGRRGGGRADDPPRRAAARRRRGRPLPASSRSTTSPRAGSRSALSARSREPRCRTSSRARRDVASANARITGCARVPSPASSGWKSVPRKNGWSRARARAARRPRRGRRRPRRPVRASRRSRARSRRSSGSARGCGRRRRSARSACPGV